MKLNEMCPGDLVIGRPGPGDRRVMMYLGKGVLSLNRDLVSGEERWFNFMFLSEGRLIRQLGTARTLTDFEVIT